MKVILICSTYWNGRKRNYGEELSVDVATAERWISSGIAQAVDDAPDDDSLMLLGKEDLEKLSIEMLRGYAATHSVDIGRSTTDKGILEKIVEAGKVLAAPEA